MNKKSNLRLWAKAKRKNIDIHAISKLLVKKLKNLETYRKAENIMIFYPKVEEINLLNLLEDESKNFYLPKIDGNNLLCCSYTKGDELCESCFKTKEPLTEGVNETILDLIIIPALAVDKNNYRLGYGGGYYDRFLKNLHCTKCVCIPKDLLVESVFPEKHDIKIDIVITE